METLEYTVIKSKKQYNEYCKELDALLEKPETKPLNDRIDLLTLLIETWDEAHNTFEDADPVELLESLMEEHKLKATHLAGILDVSKGLVSDILNYKKAISKENIRKLAEHFKVSQEAFNRPYELRNEVPQQKISSVDSSKEDVGVNLIGRKKVLAGLSYHFSGKKKFSSPVAKPKKKAVIR